MSLGSNCVDQRVRSDKFECDFLTRTFALIVIDWPICIEFGAVKKRSQMHPNITKCNKTWVLCPMVCIGCVRSEKIWREFAARSFALIAPDWLICIEFSAQTKWSQMHYNITKCNKTWVKGAMVCFSCVRSEKFRRDFVAWTLALIAAVRPILHRV